MSARLHRSTMLPLIHFYHFSQLELAVVAPMAFSAQPDEIFVGFGSVSDPVNGKSSASGRSICDKLNEKYKCQLFGSTWTVTIWCVWKGKGHSTDIAQLMQCVRAGWLSFRDASNNDIVTM